ncbi:MAG TPA: DUF302 domain-containing protein [Bacteroidales bacterium]|nr:DUF302 domain-containing protein [Bacteroidales bacterium]
METTQIVIEQKSKFSFDETIQKLTEEAENYGWKVPFIHDLQQSLAKSGTNVKPVKVIEICKPKYSAKMLELNDERIISVMMPCRISVYEKGDGKTYVSLINIEKISADLPANIAAVMKEASNDTLGIVNKVL